MTQAVGGWCGKLGRYCKSPKVNKYWRMSFGGLKKVGK